ncbi:hypothetical protein EJ06DRAFT_559516 [Trichodelitschia bisporula]|uniref:Tudor domain-containing protein n=1 Tax=Trichodelitschia bisporula TaxID=703511 RepID=A0A6G1HLD5_9PEZI|nr:hypothetical protein EJ06DRAFT_559516 [Trichodelitschia bisporula]
MATDQIELYENDLKEQKALLEEVQSGLQADPENTELLTLQADLLEGISLIESELQEHRVRQAPKTSQPPQVEDKPKWSKENHPKFQEQSRKPTADDTSAVKFKVNDSVLARWITGDKGFYPAQITSITGSSTNPIYYVKFDKYDTTEKLSPSDLKPLMYESKKRKADGPPVTSTLVSPSNGSSVISAAANINPALATQAKREPSKVSDGPPRPPKMPRQVKAKKELEAGQNSWKSFQQKGAGKKALGKESMFRTGEGVNARVGFTGSGQAMRKDPTRSRHTYQALGEDEV